VLAGCAEVSKEELVAGAWVAEGASAARIVFVPTGRFSASALPATHVCGSPAVAPVDGGGSWEYEADGDRVFLRFDVMSPGACTAPYQAVLFRGARRDLVAYRSVDDATTSIRFVREDAP
jgi:hypothetical protein